MRIIRTWHDVAPQDRGAAVALGNFDGVHRGHQAVIDLAQATARAMAAPLGVITFEPHPRQYFAPNAAPFRLMNAESRAHRLQKLGVARLYELPFSADLAGMAAVAFGRDVLAAGLGIAQVVVGADFRFGKGRTGGAADLAAMGQTFGFGVTIADLVAENGTEISSTSIRAALADGRPRDAAAMLGHWHRIDGAVVHGEKRGRLLGFPTANMALDGLHQPRLGVYAVKVDVLSGPHQGSYHGAASLGTRPMFGGTLPNLESFLFDFTGDLYGVHLSVALVDYLRPELTFEDLPALIAQIDQDCARARAILAAE